MPSQGFDSTSHGRMPQVPAECQPVRQLLPEEPRGHQSTLPMIPVYRGLQMGAGVLNLYGRHCRRAAEGRPGRAARSGRVLVVGPACRAGLCAPTTATSRSRPFRQKGPTGAPRWIVQGHLGGSAPTGQRFVQPWASPRARRPASLGRIGNRAATFPWAMPRAARTAGPSARGPCGDRGRPQLRRSAPRKPRAQPWERGARGPKPEA